VTITFLYFSDRIRKLQNAEWLWCDASLTKHVTPGTSSDDVTQQEDNQNCGRDTVYLQSRCKFIALFLVLSEDDLYAQLGQANWLAAAPPSSRSDLLSRGKELVAERKRELQKSVCDNAAIRELADGGDNYQIAIAVFGVVLTSFAHITTASAAILAALISKKGIRWLCNPVWNVRRRRDS
jgi:hypothetical protein